MIVNCYSREEFASVVALFVQRGLGFRATVTSDGTYTIELTGSC